MKKQELEAIAKAMAILFHSFPQSSLADVDVQMETYINAVESFDADAVLAAIDQIRLGREGHADRVHLPSTAELCSEIRRRIDMRKIMDRRAKLELVTP